jgi:hypothetical protein
MGSNYSREYFKNVCNYYCPVCINSGKIPNISGRFFLINQYECQCNGCGNIFNKNLFYKIVITNAVLYNEEE